MRSNSSTTMSATLGSTRSRSANSAQNVRSMRPRPSECGSIPSSGRSEAHEPVPVARTKATAGHSSASPPTRSGPLQADLDRHAAAHRVADDVGALDAQRVHRRRSRPWRRTARRRARSRACEEPPKPGQVERVDAVAPAQRRRGVEEATTSCAPRPCRSSSPAPRPSSAWRSSACPTGTWWMRSSGGRPLREPEQALEADREVEVAARVQPALGEGLDAGQLALAQLAARSAASVPITTSGSRLRRAGPHARAERGAADLPGAPDVARAGRGRSRRSPAPPRGSAPGASGTPPPPAPTGRAIRATLPTERGGYAPVRARRHALRHPNPARCSRLSRATRARWASTPAGPTVYARVHVGNARPFVVFSQLKRFLEHEGYGVTFVANVTDINDKIYDAARARRAGRRPSWPTEMAAALHRGHRPARARAPGRRAATRRSTSGRSSS